MADSIGKGVCFVAMPYGSDAGERAQYMAWYRQVYLPAIASAGVACEAHHFASDDAPVSINLDIFSHVLSDQLAIFDLAGLVPDAAPNSNVMYELGIRHAFGLPSVIFGWEGQKLPFDVGSQRAVLVERSVVGIEIARPKMIAALESAKAGRFYNPLEDLARAKQTAKAAEQDPTLQLLTEVRGEVRQIRRFLESAWQQRDGSIGTRGDACEERPVMEARQPVFMVEEPAKLADLITALERSLEKTTAKRVGTVTR